MNPTPQSRRRPDLAYVLFSFASLLLLIILLDSIFHREFGFNWFSVLAQLPFISLILAVSIYLTIKSTKYPKEQPSSSGARIAIFCFIFLYLALPVAGIWSTAVEIATCREVKVRGKEALATVENAELSYKIVRNRHRDVQTPAEANQLRVDLKFTGGNTPVVQSVTPYLPSHDDIARAYTEAKTGMLKVRYLPENPKTFFVAAAPCQESIFAIFFSSK